MSQRQWVEVQLAFQYQKEVLGLAEIDPHAHAGLVQGTSTINVTDINGNPAQTRACGTNMGCGHAANYAHYNNCARCGMPLRQLHDTEIRDELRARRLGQSTWTPHGAFIDRPFVTAEDHRIPRQYQTAEEAQAAAEKSRRARLENPGLLNEKKERKKSASRARSARPRSHAPSHCVTGDTAAERKQRFEQTSYFGGPGAGPPFLSSIGVSHGPAAGGPPAGQAPRRRVSIAPTHVEVSAPTTATPAAEADIDLE